MGSNQLKETTPVPNRLFDEYLPDLKPAELKLLLIIIRQTIGWRDERGRRKVKDWLSGSQLRQKTGCSRRALTDATAGLIKRGLIRVTGAVGHQLNSAEDRKGKLRMFYQYLPPEDKPVDTVKAKATSAHLPAQKVPITKETLTRKNGGYQFTVNDLELFKRELKRVGTIEKLLQKKEAIRMKDGEMTINIHQDGKAYREGFLKEYSIPGLKSVQLRVPYSLWMTLYHRTKNDDLQRATHHDI